MKGSIINAARDGMGLFRRACFVPGLEVYLIPISNAMAEVLNIGKAAD